MRVQIHRFGLMVVALGITTGVVSVVLAQQRYPVTVRMGDVSINKIPVFLAWDLGLYEKYDLDVDLFITTRAAQVMEESGIDVPRDHVRDGSTDIHVGGGTPLVVSRTISADSLDRIILATTDDVVRWHVVARSGINRLEQLKGKRLGFSVYGAMTHFIWLAICQKMNWDPVFDVSLIGQASGLEPLQKGDVDAFIAYEVTYAMAKSAGYRSLVDLRSWNVPIAGSGVGATESWLRDNRETARRFVKAIVEAVAVLKKDKRAAFRSMQKWYNITDVEIQELIYAGAAEMLQKPYPAVEGVKKTMELYDSHEMRKYNPEDFYDDTFVRELDESGFIDNLYNNQATPE